MEAWIIINWIFYIFLCTFDAAAINKKTYNLNSDPRNLIKYNEGDIVSDAILNKINIVSKELHDNILHIKVKSKSGEYNFKFKKA